MKLCGLLKLNILSIAQIYVLLIFLPVGAWAHSDGLDSSGCHGGSKPYHCHRSSSEMTKSSSWGNRLKCSYGSESKDCNSGTNSHSTNTINEALTVGTVKNPDGEPITLFGFNFDKDQDAALVALEEKFNCRLMLSVYIGSCHGAGVNTVFTYIIDALGAIKKSLLSVRLLVDAFTHLLKFLRLYPLLLFWLGTLIHLLHCVTMELQEKKFALMKKRKV